MRYRFSMLATILVTSTAVAGTAAAQEHGRTHLGPRASYQFDFERVGLGAQFSAPLARNLEFYPSFDYFFVDNGKAWNLNADLKYRVVTESITWLYLGAGLNLARRSFNGNGNTNAGANFFVGAESRAGRIHPFSEFRFTANDGSTGQILVGLNFTLRP